MEGLIILFLIAIVSIIVIVAIRKSNLQQQEAKNVVAKLDESTSEKCNEGEIGLEQNLNMLIQQTKDDEYIKQVSKEITECRIRLAKYALAKWEEEQKKKIESNLEDYIKS